LRQHLWPSDSFVDFDHRMNSVVMKLRDALGVAFNFSWRTVSELFGVMFRDYLAYTASACADHKTVPRRFNYFIGDEVKVINL